MSIKKLLSSSACFNLKVIQLFNNQAFIKMLLFDSLLLCSIPFLNFIESGINLERVSIQILAPKC